MSRTIHTRLFGRVNVGLGTNVPGTLKFASLKKLWKKKSVATANISDVDSTPMAIDEDSLHVTAPVNGPEQQQFPDFCVAVAPLHTSCSDLIPCEEIFASERNYSPSTLSATSVDTTSILVGDLPDQPNSEALPSNTTVKDTKFDTEDHDNPLLIQERLIKAGIKVKDFAFRPSLTIRQEEDAKEVTCGRDWSRSARDVVPIPPKNKTNFPTRYRSEIIVYHGLHPPAFDHQVVFNGAPAYIHMEWMVAVYQLRMQMANRYFGTFRNRLPVPGAILHRLLATGVITPLDAAEYWLDVDWKEFWRFQQFNVEWQMAFDVTQGTPAKHNLLRRDCLYWGYPWIPTIDDGYVPLPEGENPAPDHKFDLPNPLVWLPSDKPGQWRCRPLEKPERIDMVLKWRQNLFPLEADIHSINDSQLSEYLKQSTTPVETIENGEWRRSCLGSDFIVESVSSKSLAIKEAFFSLYLLPLISSESEAKLDGTRTERSKGRGKRKTRTSTTVSSRGWGDDAKRRRVDSPVKRSSTPVPDLEYVGRRPGVAIAPISGLRAASPSNSSFPVRSSEPQKCNDNGSLAISPCPLGPSSSPSPTCEEGLKMPPIIPISPKNNATYSKSGPRVFLAPSTPQPYSCPSKELYIPLPVTATSRSQTWLTPSLTPPPSLSGLPAPRAPNIQNDALDSKMPDRQLPCYFSTFPIPPGKRKDRSGEDLPSGKRRKMGDSEGRQSQLIHNS